MKLCQRVRQSNFLVELCNSCSFLLVVLHDQLSDESKRDLLSVNSVMSLGCDGHAIVNRVSCCKTTALESQSTKQSITFDDLLHSVCNILILCVLCCLGAMLIQHILAKSAYRDTAHCWSTTDHIASVRGPVASVCLIIRRQCIAHAGHNKPLRGRADDFRVDHDDVRVIGKVVVLFKLTLWRVYDAQRAARGIIRSKSWCNDDRNTQPV
mmetsp:Transcript_8431/g.25332  ORF Transcript_8431/g.25332 Transcript_8431/m.25332 type:complete len:210 (-) Transcript_8431:442-1071(-)